MPNIDKDEASGSHAIDRGRNCRHLLFDHSPVVCAQNEQGDSPVRQVLLVAQFLVRGKEKIKACLFSRSQQCPVLQAGPPLEPGSYDGMAVINQQPQFLRRTLVEDDLHAARGGSTGDSALLAAKSSTACT